MATVSLRGSSVMYHSPEHGPVHGRLAVEDGFRLHWGTVNTVHRGPQQTRHVARHFKACRDEIIEATRTVGEHCNADEIYTTFHFTLDGPTEQYASDAHVPVRAAQVQEAMLAAFATQPELYEPRIFQLIRDAI